jgi:thiamine biosynthesis lipoprotein
VSDSVSKHPAAIFGATVAGEYHRKLFFYAPAILGLLMVLLPMPACTGPAQHEYRSYSGETMGTYFKIIASTAGEEFRPGVDSLLLAFNRMFSTYDTASIISRFNRDTIGRYCLDDAAGRFRTTMEASAAAYGITGGYFDPTVMPLVRYWGFGRDKFERNTVDSSAILELVGQVGLPLLAWQDSAGLFCLEKRLPGVELDLSAIAKGYAVDLVADYLAGEGSEHFMVEIGGEITARGLNARGSYWTIGIDKPISGADLSQRENLAVIQLADRSVASSGNYRNFYETGGRMIGHTINPLTGYPEINDLLAVTVLAPTCAEADALATGFMAMGYGKARAAVADAEGVEALFIRLDTLNGGIATDHTEGFSAFILEN